MYGLSIILILNGIIANKNLNFNKNETESKIENSRARFSELRIKSKTVMSWSSQKKECVF